MGIDYKSNILRVLYEEGRPLHLSQIEVELLRRLKETEKKEYNFIPFYTTLIKMLLEEEFLAKDKFHRLYLTQKGKEKWERGK
jgi:hypothetical protein